MLRGTLIFFLLLHVFQTSAQISLEKSVQISSRYDAASGALVLDWDPVNGATSYRISRWNGNWIFLATVADTVTSFHVIDHPIGEAVEYRVEKLGSRPGFGYIYAGVEVPAIDDRGRCLILVDSMLTDPLSFEIQRLMNDIRGDGWTVTMRSCPRSEEVPNIKTKILDWWIADPLATSTVLILGHVAVPYSGDINPDGHGNHKGAWPCDAYYGDIHEQNWTDFSINNTSSADARNHNVPGDGKFDQSIIPTEVEFQVGRVDLWDLPAFGEDYVELTRQYLNKNHNFRNKAFTVQRRGLVENNFASFEEGFGQNGWKNFSTMFGPENVKSGNYEIELESDDYLCAYACGAGSFTSMGGVGNTTSLYVDRDIKAVFVMNFGSYFGDWDRRNNIMRASLGSGYILTNVWAGRPNWQFHHMSLGMNIGHAVPLAQNNQSRYVTGFGARFAHVSLLGDPTLRLHPMSPPTNLILSDNNGQVDLRWHASDDAGSGYYIYRRDSGEERFERMNIEPLTDTVYSDDCTLDKATYEYMIKAVKLEISASGTYYNTSIGITDSIRLDTGSLPTAAFNFTKNYELVSFEALSDIADSIRWTFGDGHYSEELDPDHLYDTAGWYEVCHSLFTACGIVTFCDSIDVESSFPENYSFEILDANCHDSSDGAILLNHDPSPPLMYFWSTGDTTSSPSLLNIPGGDYELTIETITGLTRTFTGLEVEAPTQLMAEIMTTPSSGSDGTATADISGGTPPYNLEWSSDPQSLPPGMHELTVTDDNNCVRTFSFEVDLNTAVEDALTDLVMIYPNPVEEVLRIEILDPTIKVRSLIDSRGMEIPVMRYPGPSGEILLNLSALERGTYWLLLEDGKSKGLYPLIKL